MYQSKEAERLKKILDNYNNKIIDENEIYSYYEQYKIFMDWENAPDFTIDPFDGGIDKRNYWGQIVPPQNSGQKFKFKIDVFSPVQYREEINYKAFLFHEFTHMYDLVEYSLEGVKYTDVYSSWLTEVHAIEIELMCDYKFSNISDRKTVSCDEKVMLNGDLKSLFQRVNELFDEINESLKNANVSHAIKEMQYYIGYLRFIKKNACINEIQYNEIEHKDFFEDSFGPCVSTLMALITSGDITPTIVAIVDDLSPTVTNFAIGLQKDINKIS